MSGNIDLSYNAQKIKRHKELLSSGFCTQPPQKLELQIDGLSLNTGVFYPDAGQVNPQTLIQAYLSSPKIKTYYQHVINQEEFNRIKQNYDAVILCTGSETHMFEDFYKLIYN